MFNIIDYIGLYFGGSEFSSSSVWSEHFFPVHSPQHLPVLNLLAISLHIFRTTIDPAALFFPPLFKILEFPPFIENK